MIRELVQAHGFVAALACLLDRLLEKKLKAAKLPFATEEALAHLRTVQLVDVALEAPKAAASPWKSLADAPHSFPSYEWLVMVLETQRMAT